MSVMCFGLETWGRVGAVAVKAKTTAEDVVGNVPAAVMRAVAADVVLAQACNRRAFTVRYDGRFDREVSPPADALAILEEIARVLDTYPDRPSQEWLKVGGGVGYNCSEDDGKTEADEVAIARLDDAVHSLPYAAAGWC